MPGELTPCWSPAEDPRHLQRSCPTCPCRPLASMAEVAQRTLKDEDCACSQVADICGETVELFLVADGHGGKAVAELCAAVGLQYLVEEATAAGDASAESLKAAAARTFERLHASAVASSKTAGATLTMAAWNEGRGELMVANVGDSAAMLIEVDESTMLTAEHRLHDSAEELSRVQSLGVKVSQAVYASGEPGGPLRAWPGGLAVCRTIGDADCGGVSAVPSLRSFSRAASDGAALIMCSDGVWDALSQDRVARYVRECSAVTEAAERVVKKAVKARGLRDDTTALVVWLGTPAWTARANERRPSLGARLSSRRSSHDCGSAVSLEGFLRRSSRDSGSPSSTSGASSLDSSCHGDPSTSSSFGESPSFLRQQGELVAMKLQGLRRSSSPQTSPLTSQGSPLSSSVPASAPGMIETTPSPSHLRQQGDIVAMQLESPGARRSSSSKA